jgi:JAB1/Mov34/MPN/PAD-1 ubiquitin protease
VLYRMNLEDTHTPLFLRTASSQVKNAYGNFRHRYSSAHDFGSANISRLSRIVFTFYFSFSDRLFDTTFSRAPSVTIHPTALFSILDHYLRRTDAQQRVIGTLLGTRSEADDTVSVRNAFAVLHSETSEQVAVDKDYHRAMFDLSQRVSPKESIVGWCAPSRLVTLRHDT